MHSLRLNVTDSFFPELMSLIKNYSSHITIIEETQKPDFVVGSVDEVRQRVKRAEKRGNFISHDTFWSDIENFTDSLK
jgi:hypothetical protein